MALKKRRVQTESRAPWHAVVWITAVVLVLSFSTMTLAALAQGTSSNYPKNVTGILQALTELKREIRGLGVRIVLIEAKMKSRGLIRENVNAITKPTSTPTSASPGNNLPRGEELKPEITPPPANTPVQTKEAVPPPQQPPPVIKEMAPVPNLQKEKNLNTCLQQCESAFNKCIAATNETPLVPSPGNDFLCVENNVKECKGLCSDWYFYPTPTKLPVPPIESGAQTCLLNCRTEMALCFKAAKIKYNVVDPKIPPPQAYFNELTDCAIKKDNVCRAVCPAINPSAKAPTQ